MLGTLYGQGTGSTGSFRIPDYRGLFLRGADEGAGMDPDAAERTAPTGSGTFNGVGSLQCDAFEERTHNYDQVTVSGTSAQVWPADSSTSNQVTFDYVGGAFTFEDQTQGPAAGSLSILQTQRRSRATTPGRSPRPPTSTRPSWRRAKTTPTRAGAPICSEPARLAGSRLRGSS